MKLLDKKHGERITLRASKQFNLSEMCAYPILQGDFKIASRQTQEPLCFTRAPGPDNG